MPSSHASPSSTPSPQRLVQAPLVQVGSFWQSEEQPSNGIVLPSSQPSRPSRTLSPQRVAWHAVGGEPTHAQPLFQRHAVEQARFMSGTCTAGSHCSLPMTMPSPHSGTQGARVSGQT